MSGQERKQEKKQKPAPSFNDKPDANNESQEESRQQPIWHVIVLNVLTLFAYSLVWFYKNWRLMIDYARSEPDERQLTPQQSSRLKSIAETNAYVWIIFMLLPGMQMIASARFFTDVACLSPNVQPFFKQRPQTFGILMCAVMVAALCLSQLQGPYFLLYLTASIPLAFIQHLLNAFWKEVEKPPLLVRQAFSISELIGVIIGSLFLGLIITGLSGVVKP